MKTRDAFGMLLNFSGMALGMVAWSLGEFWWGVTGAVLLTAGFAVIWTRKRHDRLKDSAADILEEDLGWRVRGRRGDGDGGSFDLDDD